MTEVIYVDVLLFLNLFVNYFLLRSAGFLARASVRRWRLLLAALLGAVYSLVIFLPPVPNIVSVLMKLFFSLTIVLVAFETHGIRSFLRLFGCFFAANFAFAGIMLAVWIAFEPNGMVYQNGAVYFPVSFPVLTVSTIICYAVMKAISVVLRHNAPHNHVYSLSACVNGKTIHTRALLDTGNGLSDTFTGTPVVIAEYGAVKPLLDACVEPFFRGSLELPETLAPGWQGRLRVIPYHSVQNASLLPAFRPDVITVEGVGVRRECRQVYIAVCQNQLSGGRYGALLPALLFENAEKWGKKRNEKADQPMAVSVADASGADTQTSGRR